MGTSESKFIEKVNEHNVKHQQDICSCGQKIYEFCTLGYKDINDPKEIKCKVLKKQHCNNCHILCDPNLTIWGGYFNDGVEKLSQLSLNHCCKCKSVMGRGMEHCTECCFTYTYGSAHCCENREERSTR